MKTSRMRRFDTSIEQQQSHDGFTDRQDIDGPAMGSLGAVFLAATVGMLAALL